MAEKDRHIHCCCNSITVFGRAAPLREGVPFPVSCSGRAWALGFNKRDQPGPSLSQSPALMTRRFPPPWTLNDIPGGYVVRDANDQSIAYVYPRDNEDDALISSKVPNSEECAR
jgi:hypothetical protein